MHAASGTERRDKLSPPRHRQRHFPRYTFIDQPCGVDQRGSSLTSRLFSEKKLKKLKKQLNTHSLQKKKKKKQTNKKVKKTTSFRSPIPDPRSPAAGWDEHHIYI